MIRHLCLFLHTLCSMTNVTADKILTIENHQKNGHTIALRDGEWQDDTCCKKMENVSSGGGSCRWNPFRIFWDEKATKSEVVPVLQWKIGGGGDVNVGLREGPFVNILIIVCGWRRECTSMSESLFYNKTLCCSWRRDDLVSPGAIVFPDSEDLLSIPRGITTDSDRDSICGQECFSTHTQRVPFSGAVCLHVIIRQNDRWRCWQKPEEADDDWEEDWWRHKEDDEWDSLR